MTVRGRTIGTVFIFGLVLLSLGWRYSCAAQSTSFNYRLTVVVDTPEGAKTNSIVRSVTRTVSRSWLPDEGGASFIASGEALSIDLGKRGLLFVLVDGEAEGRLVFRALRETSQPVDIDFIRNRYPRFVHFKDIKNPSSIENVLETEPDKKDRTLHILKKDRTADIFGDGVKISSAFVQKTNDAVEWDTLKILTWIPDYFDKHFDGHTNTSLRYENQVANKLSSIYFTKRKR